MTNPSTMQLIEGGAAEAGEESEDLPKKVIADLKAQHGDRLARVAVDGVGTFVFRGPRRDEWRRYMSTLTNDRRKHESDIAGEQLAVDTLVWPVAGDGPDYRRLRAAFETLPGLGLQCVSELQDLAGAGTTGVRTGKL